MQEQLSRNAVTKQSVSGCFTGHEIAALVAHGTAQAGLSIVWRSHLLHALRDTCTSLHIALAMKRYMN